MKPTHDDVIKANGVYSQLSFEIYKGEVTVVKFKSVSTVAVVKCIEMPGHCSCAYNILSY